MYVMNVKTHQNHTCLHLAAKRCGQVRNGSRDFSESTYILPWSGRYFILKTCLLIFFEKSIKNYLIKNTSGHILLATLIDILSFDDKYAQKLGFKCVPDERPNFAVGS